MPENNRNDEPTLYDQLNRSPLVQEAANEIVTCKPPMVFGVHGAWGQGKTSFLHLLQYHLVGSCPHYDDDYVKAAKAEAKFTPGAYENQVACVWFEAWRYQHEKAPVVALLHEMRSQMSWMARARRQARKLKEVALRTAIFSFDEVTKKIGIQSVASEAQKQGERWEQDNLANTLPSHTLRTHMEQAIDTLLKDAVKRNSKSPKPRLVVFIDDLDRCDSHAAYRLLEGLKIYLTLNNCVFVLGMNQRIVEEAVSKHMDAPRPAVRARRAAGYLEKLCQNIWRLPLVESPIDYLCHQLAHDPNPQDLPELIDQAVKIQTDDGPLDLRCLPPNPRRLKGLANAIRRLANRMPPIDADDMPRRIHEARRLLAVAYVLQFHNNLYRRWEYDLNFYKQIAAWVAQDKSLMPIRPDGDAVINPALQELEHAIYLDPQQGSATPQRTLASAFPDPSDSAVFWIEWLIQRYLLNEDPAVFDGYLHAS